MRAQALRDARFRIISGSHEFEFEYRSLDTTRRIRYSQADLSRLEDEIRRAEAECAALNGLPAPTGRRFAISGGFRVPR
jgi:hypothetical protein